MTQATEMNVNVEKTPITPGVQNQARNSSAQRKPQNAFKVIPSQFQKAAQAQQALKEAQDIRQIEAAYKIKQPEQGAGWWQNVWNKAANLFNIPLDGVLRTELMTSTNIENASALDKTNAEIFNRYIQGIKDSNDKVSFTDLEQKFGKRVVRQIKSSLDPSSFDKQGQFTGNLKAEIIKKQSKITSSNEFTDKRRTILKKHLRFGGEASLTAIREELGPDVEEVVENQIDAGSIKKNIESEKKNKQVIAALTTMNIAGQILQGNAGPGEIIADVVSGFVGPELADKAIKGIEFATGKRLGGQNDFIRTILTLLINQGVIIATSIGTGFVGRGIDNMLRPNRAYGNGGLQATLDPQEPNYQQQNTTHQAPPLTATQPTSQYDEQATNRAKIRTALMS